MAGLVWAVGKKKDKKAQQKYKLQKNSSHHIPEAVPTHAWHAPIECLSRLTRRHVSRLTDPGKLGACKRERGTGGKLDQSDPQPMSGGLSLDRDANLGIEVFSVGSERWLVGNQVAKLTKSQVPFFFFFFG